MPDIDAATLDDTSTVTTATTDTTATATATDTTASTTTADTTATATDATTATTQEIKPEWQEDWRDKYLKHAGLELETAEGKKMSKWLDRYASPAAALDALKAAQAKISSGTLKNPLPKDATDTQLSEWRAENGIPESPDGYLEKLPEGLVVGEADKPLIDIFLDRLHSKNASPEVVQECIAGYYELVEQQAIFQAEQDASFHDETIAELKGEYGPDYKRNINLVGGLLDQVGGGAKEAFLNARTAEGRRFGDDPTVMRALVNLSREINPVAAVVSGSGNNVASTIDAEISALEDRMGTKAWFKDEAAQARYRELLDARDRIKR